MWPANQVALDLCTPLRHKECLLRRRLDALGNDRQFQRTPEADDRMHDRSRLRIGLQLHHEGLVDLDLVEREGLQIAEARITRAEIVHGDADAERLDVPQDRDRAGKIVDQHALGDLDFDALGRKSGLLQD